MASFSTSVMSFTSMTVTADLWTMSMPTSDTPPMSYRARVTFPTHKAQDIPSTENMTLYGPCVFARGLVADPVFSTMGTTLSTLMSSQPYPLSSTEDLKTSTRSCFPSVAEAELARVWYCRCMKSMSCHQWQRQQWIDLSRHRHCPVWCRAMGGLPF